MPPSTSTDPSRRPWRFLTQKYGCSTWRASNSPTANGSDEPSGQVAARTQLAAALDTFDRLGARPWAQRAANELRATGITIGRPEITGAEALSPQQLEIAQLAAGMSNKEIGERLFLSHRTVGSHLYQIFPKLGITSRPRSGTRSSGYDTDT